MLRSKLSKKYFVPFTFTFAVLAILSLICLFYLIKPNKVYTYDASQLSTNMSMGNISLPPGIYRIELVYKTEEDGSIHCSVWDGSVFSGGLLTNGEFLYSGKGKTDFLIWLFESTDSLEIRIDNSQGHALQTDSLTIYETNQLWSMLLAILLFIAAVFIGILCYRYWDRAHGITRNEKSTIFALSVIVLIASLPYLLGVSISGADLTYHLHRIDGVAQGLQGGQFPVRIYPQWPHGFGYADGVMYGNALLLFPAILRLLGFTVTTSYNIFCIALNIATVWISYFCFSRIFKSRSIGVFCSAIYTLSIFRIYKLVITSALGEGSAITFMPLILYGFYRVFTEDPKSLTYRKAWIPLTLGYAGLLQTHILTCEITILLTIITCIAFVNKICRKETFFVLLKGAAGAFAISLWFVIPFLDYYLNGNLHIRYVSGRTIQDRGLYLPQLAFHWWKLGDNALLNDMGMQYSHALGVGMILFLGFLVFGILWFSGKWRNDNGKVISMGKYLFLLSGILMLLSLNIFPWDRIQQMGDIPAALISSIQFPNRFLGWGTLCLTAVLGCCLFHFKNKGFSWYYYISVICVLFGITTSSMYLLDYVNRDHERFILYNEEGMGLGYISGAEYLVEGTDESQLVYQEASSSDNVEFDAYDRKFLTTKFNCYNRSNKEGFVDLPQLLYNGYQAYDQDANQKMMIIDGMNHGIRVVIPPGFRGDIEVKFIPPIYWRVAEIISYIGWSIVLLFCLNSIRSQILGRRILKKL
jgi:hypothetical protein